MQKKHVWLVAVDGSDDAEMALRNVCAMAKEETDEVVIVTCVAHHHSHSRHLGDIISTDDHSQDEERATILLESMQKLSASLTNVRTRTEKLKGDPRKKLVDYARLRRVNFFALGRSGKSLISFGSVSNYIITHLDDVPVILFHKRT